MLVLEDDLQKLKSFSFTKEGKSIVMSNKSRISNLEERIKVLEESFQLTPKADDEATFAYEWDENRITELEHKIQSLPTSNPAWWDESRMSALESRIDALVERNNTFTSKWDESRIVDLESKLQSMSMQQQSAPSRPAGRNVERNTPEPEDSHSNEQTNRKRPKKYKPRSYTEVTVKRDVLLLTDSNGRSIDVRRLSPTAKSVQRHTCYTLADVHTFVNETEVEKEPKKILLQVGTNTLSNADEPDPSAFFSEMGRTISALRGKFPNAKIFVSSLLPRKDHLHKAAMEINELMREGLDNIPATSFIDHQNISKADMFDRLHLDTHGFYTFLCNIKYAMFHILPVRRKSRR